MRKRSEKVKQKRETLLRIIKKIKEKNDRTLNNIAKEYGKIKKLPNSWISRNRILGTVRFHLLKMAEQGQIKKEVIKQGERTITIFSKK